MKTIIVNGYVHEQSLGLARRNTFRVVLAAVASIAMILAAADRIDAADEAKKQPQKQVVPASQTNSNSSNKDDRSAPASNGKSKSGDAVRAKVDKTNAAAAREEKKAADEMKVIEQKGKKKMLLGFDLGYFMPLQDLAKIVNSQVSGRIFFQYQDIVWWFGLGVDGGFTQLDDKTYDGNIRFLNFIVHPFLTFPLGRGFDLQILAGGGISVVMAELQDRKDHFNRTSVDPMIDAGVNVMYNFLARYAVGLEGKYYHIFEDTAYNGVEVSVFFAVRF